MWGLRKLILINETYESWENLLMLIKLMTWKLMKVKKIFEGKENLWRLRILMQIKKKLRKFINANITCEGYENLWMLRKFLKVKKTNEV